MMRRVELVLLWTIVVLVLTVALAHAQTVVAPPYTWGVMVLYFIAGALGTAARVALSTTLEFGLNRRTVIEVFSGGVAGYVLPYFGSAFTVMVGLPAEEIAKVPPPIKAGILFFLAVSGSLLGGELLARWRGTAVPPPKP